jgi:cell division protein FtsB
MRNMDKKTVEMTKEQIQEYIDRLEAENAALRQENAALKDKLKIDPQRRLDILDPGTIVA